jgi:hypothetical protein
MLCYFRFSFGEMMQAWCADVDGWRRGVEAEGVAGD